MNGFPRVFTIRVEVDGVLPESSRPMSTEIHDEQMQSSGSDRFRKWSGRTQRHIKGRSEKYKGLPWRLLEGGAI